MSTDEGPEGRQRTVAELLQQYGDGSRGGSRRRRRAADDDPQDQGGPDRVDAGDPPDQPHGTAAPDGGAHQTRGTAAVPRQRWDSGPGYGQTIDPLTGGPIAPGRPDRGSPPTSPGGPPTSPGVGGTGAYAPPARGLADRSDPPTEQLPRYPDAGALTGPLTGPVTGPLGWGAARTRSADPDAEDDDPATGRLTRTDAPGRADDNRAEGSSEHEAGNGSPLVGAAPAGLAERDDRGKFTDRDELAEEVEEGPLGARGWLQLVGQWLVGAVVGALLWVGFSYLWTHHPVVALIAAVAATAGLVLLVRAIRRNDDLQTTMLAVLVGLVVTISPAVLLLAAR